MRLSGTNRLLLTLFAFAFLAIYQRVFGLSLPVPEKANVLSEHITPQPQARQDAQVVRVVDGDTLQVLVENKKEKVRIIGINTPETVDPRKPVQCFGKEVSDFAKKTLTGQSISLEPDPTQSNRDKYGRLLRYVFLNNGALDFGQYMIANGYAYEYTYDIPYAYQVQYKQAEKQARETGKG